MSSRIERDAVSRENRKAQRLQLLTYVLDEFMEVADEDRVTVTSVTVRSGLERGGEVLVIVKGTYEGRQVVAFHSAEESGDAFRGALERLRTNALKWREDTPYDGK